jgi:hypothetical protein
MELLSGSELDLRITRLLQGNDARPVAYSTSAVASQRLVRLLADTLDISTEIERDGGTVYCRLKRAGATVATGSGETSEMAIARAAANLSPATLGATPDRPAAASPAAPVAASAARSKRRSRSELVPCDICGAPMKRPPAASPRQVCNPCSYRSLMEMARSRDRADR